MEKENYDNFDEMMLNEDYYISKDTTLEGALNLIGVNPDKVKDHPKVKAFIKYVQNNDLCLSETNITIDSTSFIKLIEGIYSFETVAKILSKPRDFLSISYHVENMIKWYNIYDPDKLECIFNSEEASILIDKEYFKYASVEWTQDTLKSMEKILVFDGEKYELQNNLSKEDDDDYIESFTLNISTLYYSKKNGTLKEAVEVLMNN